MFSGVPWYNTGLSIRLGPVDARAAGLILLWLYHFRWWTFWFALIGCITLAAVEYKGYTIPNALRRLSVLIVGVRRPALPSRILNRTDR